MSRCAALVLAFALAARAIPVDEISARNGIGSLADGGSLPAAASNMSELSGIPLLKTVSENAGNRAGLTGLSTVPGLAKMPGDLALIELDSDKVGQGDASSGNNSELVT